MKKDRINKLKKQRFLSLLIIGIGLVLMIFMMVFEDEPGGIPVLLIACGIGWFVTSQLRIRSQNRLYK